MEKITSSTVWSFLRWSQLTVQCAKCCHLKTSFKFSSNNRQLQYRFTTTLAQIAAIFKAISVTSIRSSRMQLNLKSYFMTLKRGVWVFWVCFAILLRWLAGWTALLSEKNVPRRRSCRAPARLEINIFYRFSTEYSLPLRNIGLNLFKKMKQADEPLNGKRSLSRQIYLFIA